MSNNCYACGNKVRGVKFMVCSKCNNLYDLICLNIKDEQFKKFTATFKDEWLCPSCCLRPKGDNSNTPIRTIDAIIDSDFVETENETMHATRGKRKVLTNNKPAICDMSMLMSEIKNLRGEICELKSQNTEISILRKEITELKGEILSISSTLNDTLLTYQRKLDEAKREILGLKAEISKIQQDISFQEQHDLMNELEIAGIPEQNSENLENIIMKTSQKIGVKLTVDDISHAHRAGSRYQKNPQNKDSITTSKLPRPIVVRLVRRIKRDEIIKASKQNRGITSENIVDAIPCKIYINERLSKNNRKLFREARIFAQNHNFRYCWVRNGAIYIRKTDNQPAITIRHTEDLPAKKGQPEV